MAKDIPWRSVQGVPELDGDVAELLAATDSLRRVWDENLATATREEVEEAHKRSLRRHAIETGIIERLYDLDWGVTEALVAEGLTLDVAANEGGLTEDTLAVIRDQYAALDYITDTARSGSELSMRFIRELHVLITRHQPTYDTGDQFGRSMRVALPHGEWKKQPNSVTREDGVRILFVPPEQVQSEMELLLAEHASAASVHPVIRAAWLHHSFISIHPFADGNGRVARALTLLVLLQAHYAPLVVDRRQRPDYVAALNSANEGDLRPLVRFFARLERIALTSALTRPVEAAPVAAIGAVDVARAYAERLRVFVQRRDDTQGKQTQALAEALQVKLHDYMSNVCEQFRDAFRAVDPAAYAAVYQASPPEDKALWWRAQLVRTAKAVDFYSNLRAGSWWTQLRLTVLGQTLRYVVAVQKVGRGETGVLAVTAFAESVENHVETAESARAIPLLTPTPDDSVTLIYTDSADARWVEVCELVDRTLAATIARFSNGLG